MPQDQPTRTGDNARSALRLGVIPFLVVNVVVAGAGITWAMLRMREIESQKSLPEIRDEPFAIIPQYNRPAVISDADLQKVLYKLRPRLRGPRPKINEIDHALRFWGVPAEFADPKCYSGREMLSILTDYRRFSMAWGKTTPSLLFVDPGSPGVRLRTQQGNATASHVDHTVASLAEVGTPADYKLIVPGDKPDTVRDRAFRDMLLHAAKSFSLNQTEYEWSAMVFSLYMPTDGEWRTTEGQWISFDRLADRIMRQKFLQGVCFGNHRLFALVVLLRVDDQQRILSAGMRTRVLSHLQEATRRLVRFQSQDGYWDRNWEGSEWEQRWNEQPPRSRRILATGHALEWWAMAPPDVLPEPKVIERAGHWLSKTILDMTDSQIGAGYTFLTHAGRALCLWRGKFPYQVYKPPHRPL
jgi:hypothetical protein